MHKNITLNFKEIRSRSFDIVKSFRENTDKVLLILLLIVGIRLGAMMYSENCELADYAVKSFNYVLKSAFKEAFLIFAGINGITLIIIIISGFSACGLPASLGLPCVYGIVCSVVISCAYNVYKINGVFFALILIVPFAVLISILMIGISNDSIDLSKKIISAIGFGDVSGRGEVKAFLIKGAAAMAITLIASLIQSLLIIKIGEKILNI